MADETKTEQTRAVPEGKTIHVTPAENGGWLVRLQLEELFSCEPPPVAALSNTDELLEWFSKNLPRASARVVRKPSGFFGPQPSMGGVTTVPLTGQLSGQLVCPKCGDEIRTFTR